MDATARGQFEEFVAARSAALFRTAWLLTGDRQDAQDLVQSALERACRHWGRVAAAEQPEAYVRRILVNSVKDRWFARRRAPEVRFDDARGLPATAPSPYGQVELRRSVIEALMRLPAGQRAVIVLRYYEDLTEAEIADTLGCSAGTVKSQAARAIARLRTLLGPEADLAPSVPGTPGPPARANRPSQPEQPEQPDLPARPDPPDQPNGPGLTGASTRKAAARRSPEVTHDA